MGQGALYLEQRGLHLGGEHVHSTNNEHVVAAASDPLHPPDGSAAWACLRDQRGDIAGAVPKQRHGLLAQRRDDEFPFLAVQALEEETKQQVKRQINMGMLQGESTDQIVRRIRGTRGARYADGVLQVPRRHAQSIVRTFVQHTTSHARQATFEANEEFIRYVRWVSTLDSRTSQICASLDGQVYDVQSGERPPAHFNCRSTIVPVLKGWRSLGLKAPEPSTRASMSGQVPQKLKYGDWLLKQPIALQNQILGPGKAALLRRGTVPIKRFTDANLRPLTLKELRSIEVKLLEKN